MIELTISLHGYGVDVALPQGDADVLDMGGCPELEITMYRKM